MTKSSAIPQPGNVALPSDLLHAIGHVTAIWAQLEFRIDSTISAALDKPNAPDIKTTLVQPFDRRLDLLGDLLPFFLPSGQCVWAPKLIAELKPLFARRNLVVHGAVWNSAQERKGETVYWFRRVRWERSPYIAEKRAMTVAQVEQLAADISNQIAAVALLNDWATT